MSNHNAVILAGGFGTRLSHQFPGIPKPMVPISGVPILERIIAECKRYGYVDILLVLHHLPDQISTHFGDGSNFGVAIKYHIESEPMGTGGALLSVRELLAETFLVLYADVFTSVNLSHFSQFHKDNCADISIVVHPNDHPFDSDLIIIDGDKRVVAFDAPPHDGPDILANLVNAALYLVNKDALDTYIDYSGKFDIAQRLFPDLLAAGRTIFAYNTQEYIKDMGTPDRRTRVETDLITGVCASRSLSIARKAIFVDRDGTVNVERGYVTKPNELELISGAGNAIKKINKSKYLAVCITNQPVIARGECSFKMLDMIHNHLDVLLGEHGSYLDGLYFCPHHTDSGFSGEIPDLKKNCDCRKPEPGLFLRASSELSINLSKSWMIGDRSTDVAAAKLAGMMTAVVETGAGGLDGKCAVRPHFTGCDVNEVVDFILNDYPSYIDELQVVLKKVEGKKYIFISGLPRSGKTTVSGLLQSLLSSVGVTAHIVELDRYLTSEALESSSNLDSFITTETLCLLNRIASEEAFQIDDSRFDHHHSKLIDYGKTIVSPDDVIIVEGAIAFDIEEQFSHANTVKLFVSSADDIRLSRFKNKYRKKGLHESEIGALWISGSSEDVSHQKLQLDKADAIINL